MSEVTPTRENLTDPYVLQLIEALAKQDDEIERLTNLLEYARNEIKDGRKEIERLTADMHTANDAWDAASIEIERLTADLAFEKRERIALAKAGDEWRKRIVDALVKRIEDLERLSKNEEYSHYWKEIQRLQARVKELEAAQDTINSIAVHRQTLRIAELEAVKEAAQEALECLYFHGFEPGEDPRISNLAGAMVVADGTLAATEQGKGNE